MGNCKPVYRIKHTTEAIPEVGADAEAICSGSILIELGRYDERLQLRYGPMRNISLDIVTAGLSR
jgi:hypothetical protein